MNSSPPLVSIGLPVYNGLPHLHEALATLLAQDYPQIELIISDNASTDGTSDVCQAAARDDRRIRYRRNAENIGAMNNFRAVLDRARGKYFMWAAHDDVWNAAFVGALTAALEAAPDAVLATPAVIHTNEDGTLRNDPVDRPADGTSPMATLGRLLEDHAASWIYGLYHTDFLRRHYEELNSYPVWGNDVLWLADVALRYKLVGSQRALLWKRLHLNRLAPQTARATVAFWGYMFWHFGRISFNRGRNHRQQFTALAWTWAYVYRLCIRRPNLPRTLWRVVRLLSIAAVTGMGAQLTKLGRARQAETVISVPAPLPVEADSVSVSTSPLPVSPLPAAPLSASASAAPTASNSAVPPSALPYDGRSRAA